MSELRLALVHNVRTPGRPVAAVAREFGVSRKTAHKWLAVYDADPSASLLDRSRRPTSSPRRTAKAVEDRVLAVRDKRNWGPRKIRAHLLAADGATAAVDGATGAVDAVPSIRTVARVLFRHGRVGTPDRNKERRGVDSRGGIASPWYGRPARASCSDRGGCTPQPRTTIAAPPMPLKTQPLAATTQ